MKLKNNALQELYDTIVNGNFVLSTYAVLPIDKAFRECDEKLSESVTFEQIKTLQNHNDILEKSNATLLGANLDLASAKSELANKKRNLEKEIKGLHEHIDILSASEREALCRAHCAEDEVEKLKEHALEDQKIIANINSERNDLRKNLDYYMDIYSKVQKDYDELYEESKQISELKATLEKANSDRTELQKDRDSYHDLYTELSKTYDKLSEENKKLKARTDCHRYEVEWYRKHYKEKSDKIQELKSRLNSFYGVAGYEQGQTDLWDMLQNVNDSQPFELATCFPDVTGMEDILNWDLEDFLDAYKKWQEEKEKERLDHMRDYLARFCEGRLCEKCPLGSDEFKCGNGYSFKRRDRFDTRIIPDEELKRYYEKARGCGAYNLKDGKLFIHDLSHPMAGVNEAIKNACEKFTKAVEAANINISTRAWHGDTIAEKIKIEPWSCTLEGTINVEFDRDQLEKVCGVKPDDE